MSDYNEAMAKLPEDLQKKIKDLPPYLFESIKNRLDEIPMNVLDALVDKTCSKGKCGLSYEEMAKYKIPFNRHQAREIAMECVYQHLLLNKDIRRCVLDALKTNQIDGYLYSLTMGTIENEEEYKKEISKYLRKDWDFDRLSKLDQAILLISLQDIKENMIEKPIVINEAITLAKEYCDDESYKMINGILDHIEA